MTRRPLMLLLTFALAGSLAAAEPGDTVTDEAVVATDPCEPGPTPDEAMLDAHDLCDVTLRITTASGVAPTVEATLRLADAPVTATVFEASWTLGDCGFHLRHEDDAMRGSGVFLYPARITVGCGPREETCTMTTTLPALPDEFNCYDVYANGTTVAEISPPSVDGSEVTFAVSFDGDLAPLAALFAPGATLQQRHALAAPDVPFFARGAAGATFVCTSVAGCSEVGGDLLLGGGSVTISER